MITNGDLKGFATKDDLKLFATRKDLKVFATKADPASFKDTIVEAVREENLAKRISRYLRVTTKS
jgi:hypothetical protein